MPDDPILIPQGRQPVEPGYTETNHFAEDFPEGPQGVPDQAGRYQYAEEELGKGDPVEDHKGLPPAAVGDARAVD